MAGWFFGPNGKDDAVTVQAETPVLVATPVVSSMDADTRQQYLAIADRLGLEAPAARLDTFRAYLQESGVRQYNRRTVEEYLDGVYGLWKKDEDGDKTPAWGWRPLRSIDVSAENVRSPRSTGQLLSTTRTYRLPVPLPVLLRVEDISTKFPDAKFFISDERYTDELVSDKDPFLLVQYQGEVFIIERWDEPNFRG